MAKTKYHTTTNKSPTTKGSGIYRLTGMNIWLDGKYYKDGAEIKLSPDELKKRENIKEYLKEIE